MTPVYIYVLVIAASVLWAAPFPLFRSGSKQVSTLNRQARWGVVLQCVGYSLLWQGAFWLRVPRAWQIITSTALFAVACALSWTAARSLGSHLRVDAALGAGHQLVRSGPYGLVRHPIYTSMFCLVAGTGILMTPLHLSIAALLLFFIGSEIRMRIEDKLLASSFGDQFQEYRKSVPRLVPKRFRPLR